MSLDAAPSSNVLPNIRFQRIFSSFQTLLLCLPCKKDCDDSIYGRALGIPTLNFLNGYFRSLLTCVWYYLQTPVFDARTDFFLFGRFFLGRASR